MKKVGFITSDDGFYSMNYSEVEAFCKEICFSDKNRESFLEFAKNYSYFRAYFDYVMIRGKFLFFNPLYNNKKFIIFDKGAYYLNDIVSLNYQANVSSYFERKSRESFISDITTVSDSELGIKACEINSDFECMIDPEMIGMMSKTGVVDPDGSHCVTGASVLNQLLIGSEKIAKSYYSYLKNNGIDEMTDPVNYLVSNVGFLRMAGHDENKIVIGNTDVCGRKVQYDCDKYGYDFFNVDMETDSMVLEYKKILNKR